MVECMKNITHLGTFTVSLVKIIDTSGFSGRIPPNMCYPIALPRSRRPKPASCREGRVLIVWMME